MDDIQNPPKRLIIQLIITEQCNLRCEYCFELDKKSGYMSLELAKKILNFELNQSENFDEYEIDINGGEPFLCFEFIKEIVDYGKKNAHRWGKNIFFFIGTNLTLLNPEVKKWLEENRNWVILSTSLDGTRDSHNHYRNDSYDKVVSELPLYKRLYPNQGVKMTIGPDTIGSIYDGIINIESMGLNVNANVVYEQVWGDLDNKRNCLIEFARQLDLLVQHYADNPNLRVPNLLDLPIHLLNKPRNSEFQWCGAGRSMRAYDIDGNLLPCHRFSSFSACKKYDSKTSIEPRVITKCDNCELYCACPNCQGINWTLYGHPNNRTSYHCEFIKLQLLATAKLIFLKNQNLLSDLSNANKKEIPLNILEKLNSTYYIFKNLNEKDIISNCDIGYPLL